MSADSACLRRAAILKPCPLAGALGITVFP